MHLQHLAESGADDGIPSWRTIATNNANAQQFSQPNGTFHSNVQSCWLRDGKIQVQIYDKFLKIVLRDFASIALTVALPAWPQNFEIGL